MAKGVMNMKKNLLKRRIDVASGRTPADCVIKNEANHKNVFNGDIYTGDIAIAG